MKPVGRPLRRVEGDLRSPHQREDPMRGLGMALLTGAAAIILWRVFAAMFIGILGLVFKVAIVVAVVYVLMKVFQEKKKED